MNALNVMITGPVIRTAWGKRDNGSESQIAPVLSGRVDLGLSEAQKATLEKLTLNGVHLVVEEDGSVRVQM